MFLHLKFFDLLLFIPVDKLRGMELKFYIIVVSIQSSIMFLILSTGGAFRKFRTSYQKQIQLFGTTKFPNLLTWKKQPRQGARARQPTAPPNRKPAASAQPEAEEPLSPASSTSSSGQPQEDVAEEENHSSQEPPTEPTSAAALNAQKTVATQALAETTKPSKQAIESKVVRAASLPSTSSNENANPPPEDTVMEEAIRVTRGRLRKTRAASIR